MILPGHRACRLTVLDFGSFDVGPGKRRIGIPGFLIETDRGARILVDTGLDPLYARDPAAAEARDRLADFGTLIDYTDQQTAPGQLARLGLAPADITHLVLTHGHIDHVGALALFSCPILLTAAERSTPHPRYWAASQPLPWPDRPYVTIRAETEVCTGLHLLPTPGHTPGHLSLLVSLGARHFLLAADAINRASEPAEGFPDAMDPAVAARSAERLHDVQARLGAKMIWGHDPAQWPALPKAPHPLAET